MKQKSPFREGLRDGLPICVGYIPISFAFGMMARQSGLPVWAAVLISLSNFTSAGQIAGTNLILAGGAYVEIAVTTFVINIRYMLMSLSLSQRLEGMSLGKRLLVANGVTDEIFFLAMQKPGNRLSGWFFTGLALGPYAGWVGGTLAGALAGAVLPASLTSALGVALYAMFIAIVIPTVRDSSRVALVVALAVLLSCLFHYVPGLNAVPSGWALILAAVTASAVGAWRFPHVEPQGGAAS